MADGGTAGPAVRMWARSELGRRWKALIALGVIAGIAAGLALAAMAGARQPAVIVGIGDSAIDFLLMDKDPGFEPPGEFLLKHPAVQHAPNLVVRLKPGTDVAKFHERADAALQNSEIPVRDMSQDAKRFTHGTELEQTGLWLFAAAVALAALVLVGQALARTVYAMAEGAPALRALGFTHQNLIGGLLIPSALTAVTAVVVAVGTAYALSARFPVGLSRELDPSLRYHLDWPVLLPGAIVVGLLVLAGSAFAGWRAAVATDRPEPATVGVPVLRRVRNALPLPVALGTGLALQAGRGKRAVPVRPAIAGAVAGVLGIVGALGLVHGIDDALHTPSRAGQVWDASVWPDDGHPPDTVLGPLPDDRAAGP